MGNGAVLIPLTYKNEEVVEMAVRVDEKDLEDSVRF